MHKVHNTSSSSYNTQTAIIVERRGNRSQMFFEIGALKKLANFIEKHLCWSLFLI